MATVAAKILGGSIQEKNADTLGELKTQMGLKGYSASINGTAAGDSEMLNDNDFVTFAPAVKGGV